MRHVWILSLSIALMVASPAIADNQGHAKSSQRTAKHSAKLRFHEPDGFLGLRFGVPLASQLQECSHQVYGEQFATPMFCYTKLSTGQLGYAELEHAPQMGLAYTAVVLLMDYSV